MSKMTGQFHQSISTSSSECLSLFLDILDGGFSLREDKSLAEGGKLGLQST